MQLEFKNEELEKFKFNIRQESQKLIDKIIKENSPIQIGEDVETIGFSETRTLRVISIKLWADDSFGYPGNTLSFSYEGMPLKKNGEIMKNRIPVPFWAFTKNGKKYHVPSYWRIRIKTARIHCRNSEK